MRWIEGSFSADAVERAVKAGDKGAVAAALKAGKVRAKGGAKRASNILTDAPGGYVEVDASEIVSVDRGLAHDVVRVRFTNGDFVLVSGEVAQGLEQLGLTGECDG